MPRPFEARTVGPTPSTPRRWPSTRGRPRAAAQRPLPSMMIATWAGADPSSVGAAKSGTESESKVIATRVSGSNLHDFFFFGRERLVDLLDMLVGGLLDLFRLPIEIVLAHMAVLLELLEKIESVAAKMAHGHPRLF